MATFINKVPASNKPPVPFSRAKTAAAKVSEGPAKMQEIKSIDMEDAALKRPTFDYEYDDEPFYPTKRKAIVSEPLRGITAEQVHITPEQVQQVIAGEWVPPVIGQPVPPIAMVLPAMVQPAPAEPKIGSLKSFVNSGTDFKDTLWTYDRIMDAINNEFWRARDVDEIVREGDIMCIVTETAPRFERAEGWKDIVLSQELVDIHNCTVYTLEGGGKKRKRPLFDKATTDFKSIYDVPRHVQLKLPTDENEAKRFFECDVVIAEVMDNGKYIKSFCPVVTMFANRRFRVVFSRIFVDCAKKHYRDHIKGLIPGRGDGVKIKRNVSTKKILDMIQAGHGVDNVSAQVNVPPQTILDLLTRHDYQPKDGVVHMPLVRFQDRMNARQLNPNDFKYDKALGIEIETLCPVNREKAQLSLPSYVRTTDDGSIKDKDGNPPNGKTQFGVEFRILIKRSEMETRVLRVCDALRGIGCKVNKTCGLHVHIDMRGRPESEVVKLHDKLNKWLGSLRELIPTSRRNNKYCNFDNPEKAHWAAVSIDAYKRHKTLEVRVHSSTLNHIKIIQWIRLIETAIQSKFTPPAKTSTLDALKMLGLMEADVTYWLKRHHQLNESLYKDGALKDLSFLGDNPKEDE